MSSNADAKQEALKAHPQQAKAKCPSCNEADLDYRQEARPHLCGWCGYNHETGEVAGFKSASDPFAHL